MVSSRPTWSLPVMAVLAGIACAKPPATTPASVQAPSLAGLNLAMVAAGEGDTPEPCPVPAGAGLALLAGLDLEPAAKPVVTVAVGCQSDGSAVSGGSPPADAPGTVRVSAAVTLDLATPGQPDESYEGAGTATCAGCGGGKAPAELTMTVARAVRDALDLALGQARVSRLDDAALAALLTSPEGSPRSVLLAALEEAGMRRLRASLEPVTRLLDSADDEVALRAVGVLSRLQDPAALRALGRVALSKRPELPFAAVRAIADIDGPDAKRALELVAGQAVDRVLAREAEELLREAAEGGRE